ncbi:MAG TPA: LLM class flavin-dependent oxidoreductase [Thermomicrobiales bacterium]|nr:LLM class flavin-dependent oxidoreductase [Thermomicrobiales bacterium]
MIATGSIAERVGLNLRRTTPAQQIGLIQQAEQAGVQGVWMTMGALAADTLSIFAAAAMVTQRVRMSSGIVPAFTRHPLGLVGQAAVLDNLAPGRVRIGVGTSHGPSMAAYGLDLDRPLDWLDEYLRVVRAAMQGGRATFDGRWFSIDATLPTATDVPLLVSALRPRAWELAGELSDGGISWLCPIDYLTGEAQAALRRGAERAGRATPPLIAHVPVALTTDRAAVRAAASTQLATYRRLPFYARMFAAAGYPLTDDGEFTDGLLDHLVISGSDDEIARQLAERLDLGLDELIVAHLPVADAAAEERRLMALVGSL